MMSKMMKKVLTGGTFNRIHPGHMQLLKECKKLGYLVVVLASDRHNRKPYAVKAEIRKRNLEKLGIADKVVVGYPDSFARTVTDEKPDIIALGYDQKLPEDVGELLKKMKVRVVRMERFGDY